MKGETAFILSLVPIALIFVLLTYLGAPNITISQNATTSLNFTNSTTTVPNLVLNSSSSTTTISVNLTTTSINSTTTIPVNLTTTVPVLNYSSSTTTILVNLTSTTTIPALNQTNVTAMNPSISDAIGGFLAANELGLSLARVTPNTLSIKPVNASVANSIISSLSPYISNGIIALQNKTINLKYGNLLRRANYITPNSAFYYLVLDNATNTLIDYSLNITKATPKIAIAVAGQLITGAGNYTVDSAVLPFGPHQGQYEVTLNYNASLLRGNVGEFNYSLGFTNGTSVIPNTTLQSVAVVGSRSFWVNQNTITKFRLDFAGNSNYTPLDPIISVYPVNIIYFLNITLTNTPSAAVAANTPLMVHSTRWPTRPTRPATSRTWSSSTSTAP